MPRLTSLLVGVIGMVAFFACGAGVTRGGVISFVNDYEGWLEAAGLLVFGPLVGDQLVRRPRGRPYSPEPRASARAIVCD